MHPARRLLETGERGDWLTVAECVAAAGGTDRSWQWKAKQEHNSAMQGRRTPLARKMLPPGGVRPVWMVHRSFAPELERVRPHEMRDDRERESLLETYPQHAVDAALLKARWLHRYRDLCKSDPRTTKRDAAKMIVEEARAVEGEGFAISVRSLQSWERDYFAEVDGKAVRIRGLIDRRQARSGVRPKEPARSQEAIDYFYSLYHTEGRISARACHEFTRAEAKRQGWAWASSYQATMHWLERYDDVGLSLLMREGSSAYSHRFMPHLETDFDRVEPAEMFVADHTRCDFWIEERGRQYRPWLTAIQDVASRCIVGWHLGERANQDTIIAAMRMAFRHWAIPHDFKIDNGSDFTSRRVTGITKRERDALRRVHGSKWKKAMRKAENLIACTDPRWPGITETLRINLIYAMPYEPQSKATIERWFGTFHGYAAAVFPTYCGNSALKKPECLEQIRRGYTSSQKHRLKKKYGAEWSRHAALRVVDKSHVPSLDDARTKVAGIIDTYHNRYHSQLRKQTPLEKWKTAKSLRKADDAALAILMQTLGLYKVSGNGVRITVGGHGWSYGMRSHKLRRYAGRDVLVRVDDSDMSSVVALDPQTKRFIDRLDGNRRLKPNATAAEMREGAREVQTARKVMRKAKASAAKRSIHAADIVNRNLADLRDESRRTGTDDAPNVKAVRTGFEGVSIPPPGAPPKIQPDPLEEYYEDEPEDEDAIDRDDDLVHLCTDYFDDDGASDDDDDAAGTDASDVDPLGEYGDD